MLKRLILLTTITVMLLPAQVYADEVDEADIYDMAEEIATPYRIAPELVEAVIWRESRYNNEATNGSCRGLMQIREACHEERMERLGVTDLYDPYSNIKVGVDYLAELFEEYEDVGLVLDHYNGNSQADEIYEAGKLSNYSQTVLDKSWELENEHGKHERRTEE